MKREQPIVELQAFIGLAECDVRESLLAAWTASQSPT